MVIVYVWKPKDNVSNYGHASMSVAWDDSAGCYERYMSWWPTGVGNEVFGSPAIVSRSFRSDCDDEKRQPERTFRFEKIFDEPKILQLWETWKTNLSYQAALRNCSHMVRSMLCNVRSEIGFASWLNSCSIKGRAYVPTPSDIESMCDQIVRLNRLEQ
jgi:hypothetical protein